MGLSVTSVFPVVKIFLTPEDTEGFLQREIAAPL